MLQLCPCGSGLEYSLCCQPYLSANRHPQRPSQLMRSRYTAFVKQDAGYLVASWHESCRRPSLPSEITHGFASTEWLGLTIYEEAEGRDTNEGYVSFVARFRENGNQSAIIERSRFVRESGQWYYIDGLCPEFGRNDPCPCGSGKKYKKCCGR